MPEVVENSSEHFSSVSENKTQNSFGLYNHIRGVNITNGQANFLTSNGKDFVEDMVTLCQPDQVHICDGSDVENKFLLKTLVECGTIVPLPKYENCWLARTHPGDVARVESKTFICTPHKQAVITNTEIEGPKSLGNWISPEDMNKAIQERFPGCMKGRTMYVVPFSMGPVESPLSKIGIQVTDSAYVAASMRIMTRMGICALEKLKQHDEFVKCVHSVGTPRDGFVEKPSWPCDPERTIILHKPQENLIVSYGSGYGGNSLLGKKCFALRIGSTIAKREGWLAEHMLILGITNPKGEKKYITAAFPSACGKTNLAMLKPSLANYKVECVGDDIAWMRFDEDGVLRAINPENGFFGVAPGTSDATNPMAMKTIFKNTIFTNVASTSDGGVFWEGMESSLSSDIEVTDWLGNKWKKNSGRPAAHPNSRFCSPASQCPIIDAAWEDPKGVPISAILFGGRRPKGVPLIYEANSWAHGVLIGASMRSEATAAAEHRGKIIMHDPFAMRPFFGYNFGHYLKHWLDMEKNDRKMPKIFHVNWFLKNSDGKFLWPGYGENARVLEWVLKRIDGEKCFTVSPIGCLPGSDSINCKGLSDEVDMEKLLCVDKQFWLEEIKSLGTYFESQVGLDMPEELRVELKQFEQRIKDL